MAKKNWIQNAVNPKHKGYCSPMTKSTCTPKRKAFAKTMKKHHGFHKADEGVAITPLEQYEGLNNSSLTNMVFPMIGDNIFRGLDNDQPVLLQDSKGKKVTLKGPKDTTVMKGTVKESKAQFGKKIKDNTFVPNNYSLFSGVNIDGKNIDVPTYDQALKTMVEYMKNNRSPQSDNPSNIYRMDKGWEHNSTLLKPISPMAKYGKKIKKAQNGISVDEYKRNMWGNQDISGNIQAIPVNPNPAPSANPGYDTSNTKAQFTPELQAQTISTEGLRTGTSKKKPKKKQEMGYDGSAAVGVGDALTAQMGIINLLLGPDQPRRRIDNALVYNPYPQGTGSQAIADRGKTMKANNGKGLMTYEGGIAPKVTNNMFDGGTHLFKGDSHGKGGIKSSFQGTSFEAEGGEPFAKIEDKGVVFGKLKNPLTGNQYKHDMKNIMKKELKVQEYLEKGTSLVNTKDPSDKFQLLAFNSGRAMMNGAVSKQKELAESKKHLADLQEAHLEVIGEDAVIGANGKNIAQFGLRMPGGTKWKFQGTDVSAMDDKIKGFVDLVQAKGYSGYSGAKSGVDKRNTKSGRASRHSSGQALDMVFDSPDAYNILLKDPEIASYALQNGLTLINEYDPNIASQTGATAGHIHVGYDRGTKVSDKFRQDASKLYPGISMGKGKASLYRKPLSGASVGDSSTEVAQFRLPDSKVTDPIQPTVTGITPKTSEPFKFQSVIPDKITPTRDRLGLKQIMGEVSTLLTDKPDFVERQSYNPDLYTPYQVSFQDRINQNSSQFNALQSTLGKNPEALSVLAGQQYQANDAVLADEFRTNQAISNDITNKNVSLLNDAKLKNIALADTQYVRQSQAKSITKQNRVNALNSISSKILQKEASNNMLNVYKNLYPHYDFDKNYQVQKQGADGQEYINWPTEIGPGPASSNSDSRVSTTYDGSGVKKSTRVTTDPAYKREKGYLDLEKAQRYLNTNLLTPIKIDGRTIFGKKEKASNGMIVKHSKLLC